MFTIKTGQLLPASTLSTDWNRSIDFHHKHHYNELIMNKKIFTHTKKSLSVPGLLIFLGVQLPAQNRLLFRISVENTVNHVQSKAVEEFSVELKEILGDVLDVIFYHSARLFRDSEVVGAGAWPGVILR